MALQYKQTTRDESIDKKKRAIHADDQYKKQLHEGQTWKARLRKLVRLVSNITPTQIGNYVTENSGWKLSQEIEQSRKQLCAAYHVNWLDFKSSRQTTHLSGSLSLLVIQLLVPFISVKY